MELQKEMEDQGVQIVGIVLDAAGRQGKTDQEAVEKAKLLAEKTEAVYPFLIPDESLLNGRLAGISAVRRLSLWTRRGISSERLIPAAVLLRIGRVS